MINYFTDVSYCTILNDFSSVREVYDLPSYVIDEITEWDEKGGLCIYVSALLYCLFDYLKIINKHEMKFVQGFYEYELNTSPALSIFNIPNKMVGVHSFITAHNSVIDVTIQQAPNYYNFSQQNLKFNIVGKFTNDFRFYGYEEISKTPYKYARQCAKKLNIKCEDWLNLHYQTALNYCVKKAEKKMS